MDIGELSREKLLEFVGDAARRWLAHDGLWFQAVEEAYGLEAATELDRRAWERFSAIEAQRIMRFLGFSAGGGIDVLAEALKFRLYAFINRQEIARLDERRLVFRMVDCRVQEARKRRGLPSFPCKPVGLVEYAVFARTIDPRIDVRCLACPPDALPGGYYCAWEFVMRDPARNS